VWNARGGGFHFRECMSYCGGSLKKITCKGRGGNKGEKSKRGTLCAGVSPKVRKGRGPQEECTRGWNLIAENETSSSA